VLGRRLHLREFRCQLTGLGAKDVTLDSVTSVGWCFESMLVYAFDQEGKKFAFPLVNMMENGSILWCRHGGTVVKVPGSRFTNSQEFDLDTWRVHNIEISKGGEFETATPQEMFGDPFATLGDADRIELEKESKEVYYRKKDVERALFKLNIGVQP